MPAQPRSTTLWFFALSAGAFTLGAAPASAAQKETPDFASDSSYEGVTPGAGNNLPRIVELKEKKGTWVTWPGFMLLPGGGSRVFLQTTDTLAYKVIKNENKIVVRIENAKIFLSNNKNPLVTTYFDTPLERAELRARGRNVEVILLLKTKAAPVITQTSDEDGYSYIFIDFQTEGGAPSTSTSKTSG